MLYICGTPIGNMEDMTLRAIRILGEADLIAAEDTRQSIKLLNHFNIKTPLTSYHEHNKDTKGAKLMDMLKEGKNIALVTDAGMPCISDPGAELVRGCCENGIDVTVVPGPTAAVTALVLSALNARSYIFEGFLPKNKKQRAEVLKRLENEPRTTIFYEAPHHLASTLAELEKYAGERNTAVLRELTKRHETVTRGSLSEVREYFEQNEPKGEFVIVIEGADPEALKAEKSAQTESISMTESFNMLIESGLDEKSAMKQIARERGIGKREVYKEIKG